MIEIKVIEDEQNFAALEKDWEIAYKAADNKTIFNTFSWNKTWWDVYSEDGMKLLVLVFRMDGNVVGIAPFYTRVSNYLLFTVKELRFIGTGEKEAEEVASEYLDLIVNVDNINHIINELHKYIINSNENWDLISFDRMLESSVTKNYLVPALNKSNRYSTVEKYLGPRYLLKLPENYEDYIKTLGKSCRETSRRVMRKLHQRHNAEIEDIESVGQIDNAIDDLANLHKTRWTEKSEHGTFNEARFIKFHKIIAKKLHHENRLAFQFIRINSVRVSGFYGFSEGGVTSFYQSGFDCINYPKDSLGTLSLLYAIKSAIKKRFSHFDFMLGKVDSYKNRYGCDKTDMYQIKLYKWKRLSKFGNIFKGLIKLLIKRDYR